ncbi:amidohydrolase family protein [Streptomyces sp. NPDC006368]|uniref:amidohydrolase family protein n=1 Tax=Streptomyces sp. NPDC006368 TaxID=3156760 RepID=UPI0033BFB2FF
MEHDVNRRGFLQTVAVVGVAAAAPPLSAVAATGPTLRSSSITGGSVSAAAGRDWLVAEIQGIVWRVPRRGGEAVQLTDWDLEPTRPTVAPDGSLVALCAYRSGAFHLWVIRPDGTRLRQLTAGPWDDRGVAWSPDGTRLAFSSERGGDPVTGSSFAIWTLHLRSGRLTRLTEGPFEDYDPAWTPDGRQVVFVRAHHRPGGGTDGGRTLARVPASGGRVSVVRTVEEGRVLCPTISPDGRMAYLHLTGTSDAASQPASAAALMVDGRAVTTEEDVAAAPPSWIAEDRLLYVADGRIRTRHVPPSPSAASSGVPAVEDIAFTARLPAPLPRHRPKRRDWDSTAARPVRGIDVPALSPDGRSVAFGALNALWVMKLGSAPRKLVQAGPTHYLRMASWAPDGRSVLYCTDRDGLMAVHRHGVTDGRDTVLAGGGRLNPVLSPDGARLACQDVTGNLLLHDLAAGTHRTLAAPLGGGGPPGAPTWSPDGRYVAFCDRNRLNQRFREGYNLIRVIDTTTGAETRHLPAEHQSLSDRHASGPVWSPDGHWMALVVESALWVMPVAADGSPAGAPRQLSDEPADHPTWAADSRTLLYVSEGRLRLTDLDGAGPRSVPLDLTTRRRVPPARETVLIRAGQVWDGTGEHPRQDVDILLTGNRITAVEPRGSRRAAGRVIDASDRTVVPGLIDSHIHPYLPQYGARQQVLALAYGITTTASMGGSVHESAGLREALDGGHCAGPRLLTGTELIDGSRVAYTMGRAHRTRDGVQRTLRRAAALDTDFVKTYVRAPGWIMAEAARTARRLGVPSGSHLCFPGRHAGQHLTTHLQATQRLEYGHAVTPLGHSHPDVIEQYADGAFSLVATPFSALPLLGAHPALADDPRVSVLMAPWDAAHIRETAATPPTRRQLRMLAQEMGTYRRFLAHGATLALGTDAPLTPTGLHLHLALRALHAHGFTAAEALRTVTTAPARVFGLDDDLGTVEAGKLADLTVVDGDPFTDFDVLPRTPLVFRGGIPHHQADLLAAHLAPPPGGAEEHAAWLTVNRTLRHGSCCSE